MKETILAVDMGSSNITSVIATNNNKQVDIINISSTQSLGIKKGTIVDIEDLFLALKNSIETVKKDNSIEINKTVVSLCGKDSLNIKSSGKINIPDRLVTNREINQLLQICMYNASIPYDYEMIQLIPKLFIIDGVQTVNPLSQAGNNLEVYVNIIVVKKNLLANVKNMFQRLDIFNVNFVLKSYSSLFSLTNLKQRMRGIAVLDLGSQTSEIIAIKGATFLFNDFIAIGSQNITNDLVMMLNISSSDAENIKLQYSNLLTNYNELDNKDCTLKVESNLDSINLSNIQTIVHARVEELLVILKNKLKNSGCISDLQEGIIITGGLSKLKGIKELANKIFEGIPIVIQNPIEDKNSFNDFDESIISSSIGSINYIVNFDDRIELDSNKSLLINRSIQNNNNQQQEKPKPPKEEMILTPLQPKGVSKLKDLYKRFVEIF